MATPDDFVPNFTHVDYSTLNTWDEIIPGLFMGGTSDDDWLGVIRMSEDMLYSNKRQVNKKDFDSVVTLFAWANPADWEVQEYRYGFGDGHMENVDIDKLNRAVDFAYQAHLRGERVLIRCQAGLNRSGLVTALVLIKEGHLPTDAVDLIRRNRHPGTLFNRDFMKYILESK